MRPPTPYDPHERLLLFTWRIPHTPAAVVGSVSADDDTVARLATLPGVAGAFALATCQRRLFAMLTESSTEGAPADLPARLAGALGPQANALPPPEIFHGWAAVEHMTAVAAGLDAIVQGESEVGGQFRQAAARAERSGHVGPELTRILQRAVRVARNVRRTPGYGRAPSVLPLLQDSVAAIAQQVATEGRGLHAAVVGTGRMGRATHRWLRQFDPERIYVVSRDPDRAADAAAPLVAATPLTLETFGRSPPPLDLLVVALPTQHPVILPRHLEENGRPLLVCDLSLPRAVAPEVDGLPHVHAVHIEDLAGETEPHHAAHLALQVEIADWRRRAVIEGRQERIDRLDKALRREADEALASVPSGSPAAKELRRRLARMRHIALEQLTDALSSNGPEERAVVAPADVPEETVA